MKKPNALVTHLALLLICAGFIVPFAWMVSTSLKTSTEAMQFPPEFIPDPPRWQTYGRVLNHDRVDFPLFARNTLTMMIPFPVIMVSLFVLFRWLDVHTPIQFIGTFKPLWVPAWFGSAFSIFLLRQFFMTIPDELSEAARIDGCNDWGIFWRIILPLARPALAVVALFAFMATWNDFIGPLIYLQHPHQYTLALGLQQLQGTQGSTTEWNVLMAGSVLVILPVLLLFVLTQRTFIQGIATTGIK
jgi:multiple sugar transport system permease protein